MKSSRGLLLLASSYHLSKMIMVSLYSAEYFGLKTLEEDLESVFLNADEYDLKKEEMITNLLNFQVTNTMDVREDVIRYEANRWLDNIRHQLYMVGAYSNSKLQYCGVELIDPETILFWRDNEMPCLP